MFRIEFSNQASKFLKKSEKEISKRIIKKIEELKQEPVLHDSKSLFEKDYFRVGVGKYRILYKAEIKNKIILVSKIDKRGRVYKD